uniref:Cytidyltransferase-like domain-containing protein n=1 Tax=viral metagenome TaxID=1070528 RepID=A0A6C0EGA5_9ZZZZ
MSQRSRSRSRSRSRDREKSASVKPEKFESIPLISNSPRSSSVRERRTTQRFQPESVSPRSTSNVRRTTTQHRSISHAPNSSMKMPLSASHNNKDDLKVLKASNASSIINEDETYKMVFTIGRMNPPTSGHMGLISELMVLARENNLDNIGIVLSSSEDNKNPLPCHRKTQYLLEMISNMSNMSNITPNIICKETGFPMSNIYDLLNISRVDNNSKMLLIIGEDRANAFNWLNNYFPNLEIRALPRPEGAMSATKIRGFVSDNNKNAFNEAYAGILQQGTIDDLYDEISLGLEKYAKPSTKKTKKSQKLGGRKRKSKSKKSKKRRTIRR